MSRAASLKPPASIAIESLGNHPKITNQMSSTCALASGKKTKKSPSNASKNKRKSSNANSNSSNSSLSEKRSWSQGAKNRKALPIKSGPIQALGDRAFNEQPAEEKCFDLNSNQMLSEYWEMSLGPEGQISAPERSSSLNKCAVLLANILGDEASDVIMNSTSLSDEDFQNRNHRRESEVGSHQTTESNDAFYNPLNFDSQLTSPDMGLNKRAESSTGYQENVKRVSKLEEKLKRSGCYGNNSLSGNNNQQYNSVFPRNLNSTELSYARNGDAFSGNFTKQLRNIIQHREASESQSPIKEANRGDSADMSSISQVLLTPEHIRRPTTIAKQQNNSHLFHDASIRAKTSATHYENESLVYSESLATSTPRNNRSFSDDYQNLPQHGKMELHKQQLQPEISDPLTKEIEVASSSLNNNSLTDAGQNEATNAVACANLETDKNNESKNEIEDDDASTVLLLKTLNEDKSLTLEQKLSLITTAGQVSLKNAGEKANKNSDGSENENNGTNEHVGSCGDTEKMLRETLSKLTSQAVKPQTKNVQSVPKQPAQLKNKIVNNSLLQSDALRQRKLETIKEQLGVVNDIFADIKNIAGKKKDKELNHAIEELEAAVSVLPSIVDKKIFDNELKFTVEPLSERVVLLEGELAGSKARLEAMEKLHKESLETKQKEITSLKDNFNQQMANEKLQANKLRSAKLSVENDNQKLEEEVQNLRTELKAQRKKLEDCSSGFSDEIKEIRSEITSALSEVQRQKSKLASAERQNQELQWSVEAKNDEIKTFEDLAKKQHGSMSELLKELSFTRSSLHQQKSLANTLAQEVASLKVEKGKSPIDPSKIQSRFSNVYAFSESNQVQQGMSVETQTSSPARIDSQGGNNQTNSYSVNGFMPKTDQEYIVAHAANLNFKQPPNSNSANKAGVNSNRAKEVSAHSPGSNLTAAKNQQENHGMQGITVNVTDDDDNNQRDDNNQMNSNDERNSVSYGNGNKNTTSNVPTISIQLQQESPDLPSSRSCGTSSSSRLSEPKDLELSFDTNSYSNFHIPSDGENDTPRNQPNLARLEMYNSPSSSGNSYTTQIPNLGPNQPFNGHLPPYLTEQFINAMKIGWPQQHVLVSKSTPELNFVSIPMGGSHYAVPNGYPFNNPSFQQPDLTNFQHFKSYTVSYPSNGSHQMNGSDISTSEDISVESIEQADRLKNPYTRSVPLLDFSTLSNTSSAIPSAKSESKFQEGIKMLDADIQKLQNSIQQLFAVGNKD